MNKVNDVILLCGLSLLAWTDTKNRRIPTRGLAVLLIFRVCFFAAQAAYEPYKVTEDLFSFICGAICGALPFGACYLICPSKIGAGDVKLTAMIGLFLGNELIFEALYFSLCYSALYCGVVFGIKRKIDSQTVPLAPFLLLGTLTVVGIR